MAMTVVAPGSCPTMRRKGTRRHGREDGWTPFWAWVRSGRSRGWSRRKPKELRVELPREAVEAPTDTRRREGFLERFSDARGRPGALGGVADVAPGMRLSSGIKACPVTEAHVLVRGCSSFYDGSIHRERQHGHVDNGDGVVMIHRRRCW